MDFAKAESGHMLPGEWRLPNGDTLVFNASDVTATVAGVVVPPHGMRVVVVDKGR